MSLTTHPSKVLKILPSPLYTTWVSTGLFTGSGIDLSDGYIHLSTASQSLGTYDKYFSGQTDLVVAEVDLTKVKDEVKWEPSRGGDLFAHVYGGIEIGAVSRHWTGSEVGRGLFERLEREESSDGGS